MFFLFFIYIFSPLNFQRHRPALQLFPANSVYIMCKTYMCAFDSTFTTHGTPSDVILIICIYICIKYKAVYTIYLQSTNIKILYCDNVSEGMSNVRYAIKIKIIFITVKRANMSVYHVSLYIYLFLDSDWNDECIDFTMFFLIIYFCIRFNVYTLSSR